MTFELVLIGLLTLGYTPCYKEGTPTDLRVLFPVGKESRLEHMTTLWVEPSDLVSGDYDDTGDGPNGEKYYIWNVDGPISVKVDSAPLTLKYKSDPLIMDLGNALDGLERLRNLRSSVMGASPDPTLVRAYLDIELSPGSKGSMASIKHSECEWPFKSKKKFRVAAGETISTKGSVIDIIVNKKSIQLKDRDNDGSVRAWLRNIPTKATGTMYTLDHFHLYYPLSMAATTTEDNEFKIECPHDLAAGSHAMDGGKSDSALTPKRKTLSKEEKEKALIRFMMGKPVACAICEGCG